MLVKRYYPIRNLLNLTNNDTTAMASNEVQPANQEHKRKLVYVSKVIAKQKRIEGQYTMAVSGIDWTVVGPTSQMKRFEVCGVYELTHSKSKSRVLG